jgi:pentatricopeptide repeat protein
MQVIDVLEIPLLMDTCVRKGMFEEALQLHAHVMRLQKKYSDIAVVQVRKGLVRKPPASAKKIVSLSVFLFDASCFISACWSRSCCRSQDHAISAFATTPIQRSTSGLSQDSRIPEAAEFLF